METVLKKAKHIRLVIFDVDGILTSGKILYGPKGAEYKAFHAMDGLGIKLLQQAQIHVAIITAKQSESVSTRMQDLKVQFVYQGQSNKVPAYEELKLKLNFEDQNIAYAGDDLPDIPLLRRAGLAITVPHAPSIVKTQVDWITTANGGSGAVREICDTLLQAQGLYQSYVDHYLQM